MAERYYELCPEGILTYKQAEFPAGISVLDVERGRFADTPSFPWQTDDCMEDNVTWCIVQQPKYRNAGAIVRQLCDTVAKNGNLLLNIGPRTDGSFHPDAIKEIEAVGDWLRVCGEAIYSTRPYAVAAEGSTGIEEVNYDTDMIQKQTKDGGEAEIAEIDATIKDFRFTKKDGAVYAVAMGWPEDGKLFIRTLAKSTALPDIQRVELLGHQGELRFTQRERGLEITLPERKPCDYAFALKIE
jgi:alpha-L-fucosidase